MTRPVFLFAHGAGAGSSSPWMRKWAALLERLGEVAVLDYPYMTAGRKAPDRMPKLVDAHRGALASVRRTFPESRVVLIGKSMGSRVGCHVSLEEDVDAVVCLGYPLKSPKGELRDAVLKAMRTRLLFVQGTRDPLCPLADLARVRESLKAPHALHVVETGNHSLEITKKHEKETGTTQDAADAGALTAIAGFLGL